MYCIYACYGFINMYLLTLFYGWNFEENTYYYYSKVVQLELYIGTNHVRLNVCT